MPSAPPPQANFLISDQTTGKILPEGGEPYTGPVAGITQEIILATTDNINVASEIPNVFIHTGSGTDAIDVSGSNGNNILDGGTGSNFLTGGTGNDTFYLDDRTPNANIFSTINNFHSGDNATVFGVNQTDFSMLTLDNQGAPGHMGLDVIFSAPGKPTASFVLAGYSNSDLSNRHLSMSYGRTPDLPNIPGSDYLTVHAN
jgi:serralysin